MDSLRHIREGHDGERTSLKVSPLPIGRTPSNNHTSIPLDEDSSQVSSSSQSEQHRISTHESGPSHEDDDHNNRVTSNSTEAIAKQNHGVTIAGEHQLHDPTPRSFRKDLWAWKGEMIWCVLSILTLELIIVVLYWRKDKRVPQWYVGLTVNTIIALLSTLCRAMTIIPISEGISQSKWNWLVREKRPLRDLDVFDQASRGPWGSIGMVYTARGQTYAVIAAVTLITGLATSTMTQAAISIDEKLISDRNGDATTYFQQDLHFNYAVDNQGNYVAAGSMLSEIQRIVLQSILGPADRDWPSYQEPICTSSECQWQPFESLGVCFGIRNATEHLTIKNETTSVSGKYESTFPRIYGASLPEGTSLKQNTSVDGRDFEWDLNITAIDAKPKNSWPQERVTSTFKNEHSLLNTTCLQLQFVYGYERRLTDSEEIRIFRAVEMLLHFCVQEIDVKVKEGAAYTNVSQSHTEVLDANLYLDDGIEDSSSSVLMTLGNANKTRNFTLYWDKVLFSGLAPIINKFEDDNMPRSDDNSFRGFLLSKLQEGMTWEASKAYNGTGDYVDETRWDIIERIGIAISRSMINKMRDWGKEHYGDALVVVPFVRVSWAWLGFIGAQVASPGSSSSLSSSTHPSSVLKSSRALKRRRCLQSITMPQTPTMQQTMIRLMHSNPVFVER